MELATVNKIIPFSSVDGPGNRTAIFLQGCNFDCKYCHNPETIQDCIHCGICLEYCRPGALSFDGAKVHYDISKCVLCDECFHHCPYGSSPRTRQMSAGQVMAEVSKNMPFIRGITVSGGECTHWRDFLVELLGLAKDKGLSTLLDSNGSHDFSLDEELMAVTDGVMLDVKAWDVNEHLKVAGYHNTNVLKNLRWLAENGRLTEVRTVVVPGLYDCTGTVKNTARTVSECGSTKTRYKIIKYRPMGVRESYKELLSSPDDDFLNELAELARGFGLDDVVVV